MVPGVQQVIGGQRPLSLLSTKMLSGFAEMLFQSGMLLRPVYGGVREGYGRASA